MTRMREHDYSTYIMASRSRTLYVGVTGDLHKRVFQHKGKEHEGFTARYNCDRLVWFERHQYVQNAIAREKELKGWSRSKKIALIESLNAAWVDLSREWYDCEPADYSRALDPNELLKKQLQILRQSFVIQSVSRGPKRFSVCRVVSEGSAVAFRQLSIRKNQ